MCHILKISISCREAQNDLCLRKRCSCAVLRLVRARPKGPTNNLVFENFVGGILFCFYFVESGFTR